MKSLLTRRVTLLLLLGWTFLIAGVGEWIARQRASTVAQTLTEQSAGQAALVARTLNYSLQTVRGVALTFRAHPSASELLVALPAGSIKAMSDSSARRAALSARPDVAALSTIFAANVRAVNGLDALWLQDRDGLILASSDREQASSRIGRLSSHSRFSERLNREDEVQFYAPSLLTSRPGFLFGASILRNARVIGAVVARSETDSLTQLLAGNPETKVLVTDSAGRVLASSDRRLVLRRIEADGAVADTAVLHLQTVTSLLGPLYAKTGHGLELLRAWVSQPMDEFGLTLHFVRPLPEARSQLNDTRLIALLVWLAGVVALLADARGKQQLASVAKAERRAVAEQQRVSDLLNTSYDAVVTLDAAHRVVDWNVRAEVVFGYAASEMVGTDPTERIVPPRWRAAHRSGFDSATQIGRSEVFGKPRELTALNRKGNEFPVELTMRPAKGADGGQTFVAFFRDISTRKQEEQIRAAVAERVERYRSVVADFSEQVKDEWAPAIRRVLTESKRAIGVERASFWRLDDAAERMTCELLIAGSGEDPERAGMLMTRDQSPAYFRAVRRRQQIVAPHATTHEATRDLSDGYLVPLLIESLLATPVWFEGRHVGILCFEHVGPARAWEVETTEFASTVAGQIALLMESVRRIESEKALNAERERMERVLRRSPIAQTMWDGETGLIFANPAMLMLFGYPDEASCIGKFVWTFSPALQPNGRVSREFAEELVSRLPELGQLSTEWTHERTDGSTFPAAITLVDLQEPGRVRFIATIVDLTEQKEAQAAIIAAKEAAEQAEATKSAFLATMSHEIRTPMNGVMSMAEMLDQTELDEDQRGMLHVVRSSADSLLTIINDILDFSKIEAGKMTIESVELSPAAIIEDVVQLLAGRAQDKEIGLYAEVQSNLPATLLGDPTRLRQVVVNLAGNALKFTEDGYVRVRAGLTPASHLRIEISDTGIGLTEEQRARLFQPFMQADTSTARKFGGTGLGLSICRKLVEMMGGKIGVDSTIGRGSTFWFEVPLPVSAPPTSPEVRINDLAIMLAGFPEEHARILDAYVRAAGCAPAIVCSKASEALERLTRDASLTPVVVLPTYPEDHPGGGLQIARALREMPGREQTPVCLVVPSTLISSASAAAQTGFIATTSEPVRRDRFWRMLAVAVGRAEAERRVRRATGDEHFEAPPMELAAAKGAVILVAEDNRTNQIVIGRLLQQLGLAYEIADNGKRALDRLDADRTRFGLLLSDFHMPEMDGFELTAHWRDRERHGKATGRLPILALTADALAGMAERCKEAGMDGYLTKPIVRDALVAELEHWLPVAFDLRTAATARPPRPVKDGITTPEQSVVTANTSTPASASAATAPPAIDMAAFAKQLGIEPGPDAIELLEALWESVADLGTQLRSALDAKNRTALREVAHGGKGAAKSIGAFVLGDVCSALQDDAEARPWEELATAVAGAIAEHARVGEAVAAMTMG